MYKTKDVLAYWDYDRSYNHNMVIVQATDMKKALQGVYCLTKMPSRGKNAVVKKLWREKLVDLTDGRIE